VYAGAADPSTSALAPAPLDLHEGISDPAEFGCPRWPESLRLLNRTTGELVRGRCRATNLCGYCAKLAAVENAELLAIDAMEHAPAVWIVLTTRTPDVRPASFWRSREQVWKAVRRRWPAAEYAFLVEFTTGYGARSGGLRRPHWNLLVKGVPVDELDELRQVVVAVWCRREDAEPAAQHVGAIAEVGGLMRYLALHFQKESQAPPAGWRGHRFRTSRGYLVRPAAELRAEAKRSLRLKRLIWRGLPAELAELELELLSAHEWELRQVRPETFRPGRREMPAAPGARRAPVDRSSPVGSATSGSPARAHPAARTPGGAADGSLLAGWRLRVSLGGSGGTCPPGAAALDADRARSPAAAHSTGPPARSGSRRHQPL
jgi:hypothetical protein